MGERGNLSRRHVAEIIEDLHHGKKTARVRFSRPESKVFKDVWFENGEIVSSGTNEPREYLGSFLISAGRITEADFVRAYRTQVETKVLFGKVLAMFGIVTEAEVATALKGKTEETILDVFLWPDGVWEIEDGLALDGQRLPISVDIGALIAEGERRALEWTVIRQTLPDFEFEAEVVPMPGGTVSLAPRDTAILRELTRARPPAEAALELRLSPYQFLQRVYELQKRGRLKVRRKTSAPPLPPRKRTKPPQPAPPPEELVDAVDVDVDSMIDRVDAGQRFVIGPGNADVPAGELRTRIPALTKSKEELLQIKVDAEEGYLLSRIDGVYDVATVVSLCPFKEIVALERISTLSVRGIISLRKP